MTHRSLPRPRERGVVLIITLILLAVIAVSSAMAMRLAQYGGLVGQNMRAHGLAMQAAEAGLRHCERRVGADPFTTPMMVGDGGEPGGSEWLLEANWTARSVVVPPEMVDPALDEDQRPRCLIRMLSLDEFRAQSTPTPATVTVESRGIEADRVVFYRITARGYSPDFRRDGDGRAVSGAEVWLQSMVRTIE